MDDKLAYQVCEHTYGAAKWLLDYIRSHRLIFNSEDRPEIFEFHMNRIDSLFSEIERPLTHNPLMPCLKADFGKRTVENLTKKRSSDLPRQALPNTPLGNAIVPP
jgi:hypothetical protein